MDTKVPSATMLPEATNGSVAAAIHETSSTANQPKNDKAPSKQPQSSKSDNPSSSAKVDGAALKAQKKAEKAAKRAQVVAGRDKPATPTLVVPAESSANGRRPSTTGGRDVVAMTLKGRSGSNAGDNRPIALRGKQGEPQTQAEPAKEDKTVDAFRHLYPRTRTTTLAGASKDIHPAVLALGLQMSNWVICGSNARLVATLQVFKQVLLLSATNCTFDG